MDSPPHSKEEFHSVRFAAALLALYLIGCSPAAHDDNEDTVMPQDRGGVKQGTMVEFRSQIGNTIVLPSDWSVVDTGQSFLLNSPDGHAAINVLSFSKELVDNLASFQALVISEVEGEWEDSEWQEIDIGGVPGRKRHLTSRSEDAESAWRVYVLEHGQCYHAILLHASSPTMLLNGGFYEESIRSFKGTSSIN